MIWGSFGTVHFLSLAFAVVLLVGLYFLAKHLPARACDALFIVLSFSGIAAILFNLLAWGSPLEYLPLHLCSLNALILPVAVITKSERLGNILLLWSLGALFALVANFAMAETPLLSWTFVFYYFPHVLEFGIPLLFLKLGKWKVSAKHIPLTIAVTMVVYTLIHLVNVFLNGYAETNGILNSAGELLQVNYMFSITPENPLLALFWSVIPHSYWYMFLAVPVIALYLGFLCGIAHLFRRKSK